MTFQYIYRHRRVWERYIKLLANKSGALCVERYDRDSERIWLRNEATGEAFYYEGGEGVEEAVEMLKGLL